MSAPARPAPVRIEDLSDPCFPAEVRPVLDMLAEAGASASLEPDDLEAEAREATGLRDMGDPSYRDRLEVLCSSLVSEAGLSPVGVAMNHAALVSLLKNRLLIEDLTARHPEILDEPIERPIVICGLPRTGTTHLHNLISADPALRSLPYWESLEPVLASEEQSEVDAGAADPRRARTEAALDLVNTAMPLFKRMHEMTVDHVHEEIQLLAIDFSSMLFETTAVMPSWRDYYLGDDQTRSYRYMRKVLQVLQWQRGGGRWVLKSPQHVEQFAVLAQVFPDATFVVTHRDPASVTLSAATMIAYTARLGHAPVHAHAVGSYWADRIRTMLHGCVDGYPSLPASQTIDVQFERFMAGDIAMVERIYELAGQPMGPQARSAMQAFMADHPRGRHGGITYDWSDLGLDAASVRGALEFYVEAFGVCPEG